MSIGRMCSNVFDTSWWLSRSAQRMIDERARPLRCPRETRGTTTTTTTNDNNDNNDDDNNINDINTTK